MPVISNCGEIDLIKMEKSVIDWLVDKLFDPPTLLQEQKEWIEKAKQMERLQISETYYNAYMNAWAGIEDEFEEHKKENG
jgi:hypothetical protein